MKVITLISRERLEQYIKDQKKLTEQDGIRSTSTIPFSSYASLSSISNLGSQHSLESRFSMLLSEDNCSIYSDLTQDETTDDHSSFQDVLSRSEISEKPSYQHSTNKSSTISSEPRSQTAGQDSHTESNVTSSTTRTKYGSNSLTEEMVSKDLADKHRRNKMSINHTTQLILRKDEAKAEKANAKEAIKKDAIVSFDNYSKQKNDLYRAKVVLDGLLREKAHFEREARFKDAHPGIKSPTGTSGDSIVDIVVRHQDSYRIEEKVAVFEDTLSFHIGTCTDYIESLTNEAAISWKQYEIDKTAIEHHMGPIKAFMGYLMSPMNHFSINALEIMSDSLIHQTLAFTQYLQHTEQGKRISYAMIASVIVTLGILSLAGVVPMMILGLITVLSVVVWAGNKMQVVEDTQPRDDYGTPILKGHDMAAGAGHDSSSESSIDMDIESVSVTTSSYEEEIVLDETTGMHSIPGRVTVTGGLFETDSQETGCDPNALTLGSS